MPQFPQLLTWPPEPAFQGVATLPLLPGFSSAASVALPPLQEQLSWQEGQPGACHSGMLSPPLFAQKAGQHCQLRLGVGPDSQPRSTPFPARAVAMVTDAATQGLRCSIPDWTVNPAALPPALAPPRSEAEPRTHLLVLMMFQGSCFLSENLQAQTSEGGFQASSAPNKPPPDSSFPLQSSQPRIEHGNTLYRARPL